MSAGAEKFVEMQRVRVMRAERSGVLCDVGGREIFIPYAELCESPAEGFVPGQVVTVMVRPSFARARRLADADRRSEARRTIEGAEPLWLFCPSRGIGGQATLREVSRSGLSVRLDRRYGWRLIRALREAQAGAALVEVARLPHDKHRQARIVWAAESAANEILFGLALTMPLGDWAR